MRQPASRRAPPAPGRQPPPHPDGRRSRGQAARTGAFRRERYRRIARRRFEKQSIVAVGRSILVNVWALLSDDDAEFVDLGPDHYAARAEPERKVRRQLREPRPSVRP